MPNLFNKKNDENNQRVNFNWTDLVNGFKEKTNGNDFFSDLVLSTKCLYNDLKDIFFIYNHIIKKTRIKCIVATSSKLIIWIYQKITINCSFHIKRIKNEKIRNTFGNPSIIVVWNIR